MRSDALGMSARMSGGYAVFHKQLGDLVLLEPALAQLAARWGGPVRLLTRSGHGPLVRLMHGVKMQRGVGWRPARELVCFDARNKSALRGLVTPALRKVCLVADPADVRWFHRAIFGHVEGPGLGDDYVAEYFWRLAGGSDGTFHPPRLEHPPATWAPMGIEPGDYVLVNATSGWRRKCWRPERWAELIRELHRQTGAKFLLTSASLDWQVAHVREVASACGGIVQCLAGGTTMENFLWLCANARLILTVDGSPAHLGRAFGVPSVALFGPTHLPNWHLPSATTLAVQAPTSKDGSRRTKDIRVEQVLEAARELL